MPRTALDRTTLKLRLLEMLSDGQPRALCDLAPWLQPHTDSFLRSLLKELAASREVWISRKCLPRSFKNTRGTMTTIRIEVTLYSVRRPR